jgi:hypothetical protein
MAAAFAFHSGLRRDLPVQHAGNNALHQLPGRRPGPRAAGPGSRQRPSLPGSPCHPASPASAPRGSPHRRHPGRPGRGSGEPGEIHQPRTNRHVECPGVGIGQHPPDRGLRRRRRGSGTAMQVHIGEDRRRHVSDSARDRGVALHPGHDRRRSQRQHGRNRVISARACPAIRYPSEKFQQVTACIRYRDRHDRLCRCGHGSINDRLTRDEAPVAGICEDPCSYRSFVTFSRPARCS